MNSKQNEFETQCLQRLKSGYELNVTLAPLTTYNIGGPARFLVRPRFEQDLSLVLESCQRFQVPLFILGSGSNVLFSDQGFDGLVVYMGPLENSTHLEGGFEPQVLSETKQNRHIRANARMPKAALLEWAYHNGWSGLEFSAGIPGTLGGAVFMNAGTKWGSYSKVIDSVRLFSLQGGFQDKTKEQMGFRYRGHGDGLLNSCPIIVSVDFSLHKERNTCEQKKLIDEILVYRGQRQPLEFPNCGSVFKNPAHGRGAGRLIEAAGLKGLQVGGAMVSQQHANFISNVGGATAEDVKELIKQIQRKVNEKFQVMLETELIQVN